MTINDFTYSSYKDLIELITDSGYEFADYHNNDKYSRPCILRHDIDFDISKARNIAELEYNLGVKSTYFVLLRTNFYNVFSKNEYRVLNDIKEMGHEIGLHFDETQTFKETMDYDEFCQLIKHDCELLSTAIGERVKAFSFHIPSKEKLNANHQIDSIENSYSQKYFNEYKYLSDSSMRWREDVISIIKSRKFDKIHLLTHPFWYAEKKEDRKTKMLKFVSAGSINRYNDIENNFKDISGVILLEDIN